MSRPLTALIVAGIAAGGVARAEVPSVAVDIAPVHALVARVMAGVGEPDLVLPPGASPHDHALRPSEAQALQQADVVFWMGPALTLWLDEAIGTLAPHAMTRELLGLEGTTTLEMRAGTVFADHDGHGREEVAHGADAESAEEEGHAGHEHGPLDPHAWLDPANARLWLDAIAADLSAADPAHAGAYRANAAAGRAEIDALVAEIDDILAPARGGSFIVFHDAYQYFEAAFDLPAAGAISLGDAARPGPARIEEIRDRVDGANVTCVLAEPQFNPDLVETVLDGTKARSAVIDPLGSALQPGPALYPELMRQLGQGLADCLRP